ncbi:MAG: DEAD/DEAH box helicase [Psychrobacillus sp.]
MIQSVTDKHIFVKATNAVGQMIDATYLKSKDAWRLPFNLGALRDLHKQGYDVLSLGKELSKRYYNIADFKELETASIPGLRPYQAQDVHFLSSIPYAGIFNQQRTGKTPTVCKLLEQLDTQGNAIVIVPSSLVLNWRDELQKWTHLVPHVVTGTKAKRQKAYKNFFEQANNGVLILSKDILRVDVDLVQSLPFHTMVVDESHFLRNYNTKQSQAIYKLAKFAKRRYALTGTPASKSPADVYGILHFLDAEKWSSYWQFVERYFVVKDQHFGGKEIGDFKSEARKKEYIEELNILSVQRKRKDVMKWLPKKQYQTIKLQMSTKQAKAYDEMLNTFEVEDIGLDAVNVLTQMLRLRQLTTAPGTLGMDELGAKYNFVLEWIENNPGEQVVIFSNFSSGLKTLWETLKNHKVKAQLVIGATNKGARKDYVDKFQKGKLQVLLCNIEAAGTGLTLDKASTVIFLDRHYTPAANEQAEDRIVATTESSNLSALIVDLVCEGSIDEKILQIVKQKKDVTEVANNYKNIKDWLKS